MTAAWIGAAACTAIIAGCAGGSDLPQGGRPVISGSAAADAGGVGPVAELEFFDRLESVPLVCHDEVLHALLLLSAAPAANTDERLAAARAAGWIDPGFDRNPREAATIGEVARMLVHIRDGERVGRISQDRAVSRLVTRGWLPTQAKAYQGLTGVQLISLVGAARREAGSEPTRTVATRSMTTEIAALPPDRMPETASARTGVGSTPAPAVVAPRSPRSEQAPGEPRALEAEPTVWIRGRTLRRPER